jgi:hypothetical protein
LHKAIQKVNELKKATLEIDTDNQLRYFRGSSADMLRASENENVKRSFTSIFCCWEQKSSSQIEELRRKPPSRWKAVKIVMLTTGCFLVTWVIYFKIKFSLPFLTF